MTLEELARTPACLKNGKWRFPSAQELRENWLLPHEYAGELEKIAGERGENPLDFEAFAIAFYRVQNRESSSFYAQKLPRESATLLQLAQILEDDELYLQEMARAGFATLIYLGYWENVVRIGGRRLATSRAIIEKSLAQTEDKRCAQTLRKLLSLAPAKQIAQKTKS